MAVSLYWIVQADATATPTGAQIVAGQDGTGAAALKSGSEAYTTGGTYDEATAITGLTPGTAYEQWWTASADGVTFSTPTGGTITTIGTIYDGGLFVGTPTMVLAGGAPTTPATITSSVTATIFPWGNGDGATTFNVPDMRGRAFVLCVSRFCARMPHATYARFNGFFLGSSEWFRSTWHTHFPQSPIFSRLDRCTLNALV